MRNKNNHKICKKCKSREIKKDGFMRGKQRYKCKICNYVFQNKSRSKKEKIDINKLWNLYCFRKQTYKELAEDYWVTIKTIQTKLDGYEFIAPFVVPGEIILLIDTTYFWEFWIMVFKDYKTKKVVHYKLVKNENNKDYKNWVKELQKQWWSIKAIVCDGRKWLLTWFSDIPTQMCNFHQVAIMRRYITKNPILEANKDLKKLSELLVHTDRETFTYYLEQYWEYYSDFLKEKRLNKKWKLEYAHKRTRSAYNSLKNNLKYLFTWYDYLWTVDIPNTTNWLEWLFWHIKPKISLHRGLKKERKIKLILSLLHGQF